MGLLDKIRGNPFEKLKKEEITAEKIRLEREERLKTAEVEKLAKQKKELFDKGFNATKTEQRTLARKIKQLDRKVKQQSIHLKKVNDQIMVCDNMSFIQENQEMLRRDGLISKLNKMPKSKLDEWLAKVNVADQIGQDNGKTLLSTMDAEYGLMGELEDDTETKELLDVWGTSDAEDADEVFEKWDKKQAAKEEDEDLELA